MQHNVEARREPWHVLVVDDDPDLRESVCEYLTLEGFDVAEAADGLDALDLLDGPHAIVCDLDMPRLDGPGLVRRLRRSGRSPVVIVLSARFDLLASATELGQVYALAKPFQPDRLADTLREALEGRC
jgi:DNA-binding response OmpR family regulator